MAKRIAILGSTGSIGVNALEVVRRMPGEFSVVGLSAHSSDARLSRQIAEFHPRAVALFDEKASLRLKNRLNGAVRHLPPGEEGLIALATHPAADIIVMSVVGGVGFAPLLAALRAGKTVALANKEPMVMAGRQLMEEARRCGGRILPVDSEPSAVLQCLQGGSGDPKGWEKRAAAVRKVFLTASGGAFYKRRGSLSRVTVAEALAHPTWKMGRKITIDCATLMNKGFEAIEIQNLFGLRQDQIEIVIHRQSVIHSGVEFQDGSVLAQLSPPDMKLPIQYAMTYPARTRAVIPPLDLCAVGELTFAKPDFRRFPCLRLAHEAARTGGGMPAVLNAADEIAVSAFIAGRLSFTAIPKVLDKTMRAARLSRGLPGFDEVLEIDRWARRKASEVVEKS